MQVKSNCSSIVKHCLFFSASSQLALIRRPSPSTTIKLLSLSIWVRQRQAEQTPIQGLFTVNVCQSSVCKGDVWVLLALSSLSPYSIDLQLLKPTFLKSYPDWLQQLLTSQCSAIIVSVQLMSDKAVAVSGCMTLDWKPSNKVLFVLQINEVSVALPILDRQMYLLL